jgi:hypothetical protein
VGHPAYSCCRPAALSGHFLQKTNREWYEKFLRLVLLGLWGEHATRALGEDEEDTLPHFSVQALSAPHLTD